MVIQHNNGVFWFYRLGVQWRAHSIESAISIWAFAHDKTFREAVLTLERS